MLFSLFDILYCFIAVCGGGTERNMKLLASDFDGTLFRNGKISEKEIDGLPFPFTQIDTNAVACENAAAPLAALINKNLKDYVYAHLNGINVDITPKSVNKPTGICRLIAKLNIKKDDTYVIGDNLNDLEMM